MQGFGFVVPLAFSAMELPGYVEARPKDDLHEHRITHKGMDKLWELGLWPEGGR